MPIIETKGLTKSFGSLKALSDVTFDVREKEILAVVGPNGSGKTTLFNVLSKVLSPDKGTVVFDGHRIDHLPSHRITHMGLSRTYQVPSYFKSMTVEEQILLAARFGGRNSDGKNEVSECLEFAELGEKRRTSTDRLNIYEKKKLMLASALATGPKVMMLDEPLAGLDNKEVAEELKLITKVREKGITIMIIEHNIRAVFAWADRAMVMHRGEKLCEGAPAEVSKDSKVVQVYLGEGYF